MKKVEQFVAQNEEPEFYFEDETDKAMGIETQVYANGSKIKKVKLRDGRLAVCRMLKGKDFTTIQRLTNNNKEDFQNALMSLAITLDGQPIVLEDLKEIQFADYTTLLALSTLNF